MRLNKAASPDSIPDKLRPLKVFVSLVSCICLVSSGCEEFEWRIRADALVQASMSTSGNDVLVESGNAQITAFPEVIL
jgi:hypothetical protein